YRQRHQLWRRRTVRARHEGADPEELGGAHRRARPSLSPAGADGQPIRARLFADARRELLSTDGDLNMCKTTAIGLALILAAAPLAQAKRKRPSGPRHSLETTLPPASEPPPTPEPTATPDANGPAATPTPPSPAPPPSPSP